MSIAIGLGGHHILRPKRLKKEEKRLPTLQWMRELDNALKNTFRGRRLHMFKTTKKKLAAMLTVMDDGKFSLLWLCLNLPFLNLHMDKESKQHAAWCYLAWH
jgi:hypothetical protein